MNCSNLKAQLKININSIQTFENPRKKSKQPIKHLFSKDLQPQNHISKNEKPIRDQKPLWDR